MTRKHVTFTITCDIEDDDTIVYLGNAWGDRHDEPISSVTLWADDMLGLLRDTLTGCGVSVIDHGHSSRGAGDELF